MITKIKELYKFLFITEKDKGAHLVIGFMIGILFSNLLYNLLYFHTEWLYWMPLVLVPYVTMFGVWLVAFAKEWYDEHKGKERSYQDIKWTMIGGLIGLIILTLFYI